MLAVVVKRAWNLEARIPGDALLETIGRRTGQPQRTPICDGLDGGTVFVPLEAVTDPRLALAAIGRAAGADLARTGSPLEALTETSGDGAWLLILDNLEQVLRVAHDLGELLGRCFGRGAAGSVKPARGSSSSCPPPARWTRRPGRSSVRRWI
jgi:F420H(2)-dependent quinone reductase